MYIFDIILEEAVFSSGQKIILKNVKKSGKNRLIQMVANLLY